MLVSGAEQGSKDCSKAEYLHSNQDSDEGVWLDVSQTAIGLPQHGAPAEDLGQPDPSLPLQEVDSWRGLFIQD